MNFKQLEAFVAFMTTGSTIGAAQRLQISQPAISRLLSQFEADMSLPLFVRRKGRLYPSNGAEALLPDVQNMMLGAESLQRHVNQLRLGGSRHTLVRAQVPGTVAHSVMPEVAESFLNDHPEVALEILAGSYEASKAAVLGREADLALVSLPTVNAGLEMILRFSTEAVCVMPPGHSLQALPVVTPADLQGVDLVLLGRQSFLRQQIDQTFRQGRLIPHIRAEAHAVDMACRLAARGIGVSIVNGLLAHLCLDMGVVCRPFRPVIGYDMGIAVRAGQSPHPLVPELAKRIVDALARRAGEGLFTWMPQV